MKIIRRPSTPNGTFGEWTDDEGNHICYTGELPWANNQPDISCIPTGTYNCIPHNSPNHPGTWQLLNVPNRSGILIHNGNFPPKDSLGCILVGDSMGIIDGLPAVLHSVVMLKILQNILPDTFSLEITNA